MKNKRTYEQYTILLNALKKAYASIVQTEDLQKELKIPSDVTNKFDFLKRTMIGTYVDVKISFFAHINSNSLKTLQYNYRRKNV